MAKPLRQAGDATEKVRSKIFLIFTYEVLKIHQPNYRPYSPLGFFSDPIYILLYHNIFSAPPVP
jgi:hypothetical protein